MTREGFPERRQDDLRYYLDSTGHFTPRLREHYRPREVDPRERHAVYVKAGASWAETPYATLRPGMVARLFDRVDGVFVTWADTGTTEVVLMEIAKRGNEWAVRVRKPTEAELSDA
tara:strand:+ start:3036 stop:3383 length:348 start_codon:yes stop_codon:yes gene_type:complete